MVKWVQASVVDEESNVESVNEQRLWVESVMPKKD